MGWSLILSQDHCSVSHREADFLGSRGSKALVVASNNIFMVYWQCSQGGFPLYDSGAVPWAWGEWLLPLDGEAAPAHTASVLGKKEGLLFTKNWCNDAKDWHNQMRKILNYLAVLIAVVIFTFWGWTRAILQRVGVNPILKYYDEY